MADPHDVHRTWMADRLASHGIADLIDRPLGCGVAVSLLWALALEIDELRATTTGERVCRACSGRGRVMYRLRHTETTHEPPRPVDVRRLFDETPCSCDASAEIPTFTRPAPGGIDYIDLRSLAWRAQASAIRASKPRPPTRPHTVSLRRLVSTLAAMRSPVVTDWPEQWMVNRDAMEAAGWHDVVLPGDTRVTPAWACAWWRAFGEWTATGHLRDMGALGDALATVPRRNRYDVGQRTLDSTALAAEVVAYDRRHDDIADALVTAVTSGRRVEARPRFSHPSIQHAVRSVPGVRWADVQIVQPWTLQVRVCGDSSRNAGAIAQAIFDHMPMGYTTLGDIAVELDADGWATRPIIRFSRHPALEFDP